MGAEHSSSKGRNATQADDGRPVKTCYYELLEVDRQASEDEIKKAYRKKALEFHPDRNYGNVENATMQFAEIQSAYEVLSDPQERAWYDSHRDAILCNGDTPQDHFEHNIRVTTSGDIITLIGKFTKKVPFTDAQNGFYGSLRSTFLTLAKEEEAACEWNGLEATKYPDFGGANDSYEEVVRPFYAAWIGFTTKKSFSWMDTYRYADAPDRRIRRLMEKENRRLREEAIREFNDAIRSLVAFVRKRDPRFIPSTKSEADRQRLLREAAIAQAARIRAANQAKLDESVLPDWIMNKKTDEETFTDSELAEEEHYKCVICSKLFKSEKQYETHEKSKKHTKAARQLKRHMQKEDKALRLDSSHITDDNTIVQSDSEDSLLNTHLRASSQAFNGPVGGHTSLANSAPISMSTSNPWQLEEIAQGPDQGMSSGDIYEDTPEDISDDCSRDDDLNTEYAPRREVEVRLSKLVVTNEPPWISDGLDTTANAQCIKSNTGSLTGDNNNGEAPRRIGKAKAKRAKKAARQEPAISGGCVQIIQCATCNQTFSSKTQLFSHIKDQDHARPMTGGGKSVNGTKPRR